MRSGLHGWRREDQRVDLGTERRDRIMRLEIDDDDDDDGDWVEIK